MFDLMVNRVGLLIGSGLILSNLEKAELFCLLHHSIKQG